MNRLGSETSPYLLQHRDNPVDWYPWGNEALRRAREENKPLLVSIGYSACHWCHVMAHESFEDDRIAALMNESFVCVKIDREERPDIDAICMEACQALNGHGGWPLNVFLTPDQTPFFAGTYFPADQRPGMPSWPMVIEAIAEAWRERPEEVREQGARLAQAITESSATPAVGEVQLPASVIADSVAALESGFDSRYGGWGGAPKFPPHCTLEFLLAAGEREMSLKTLREMAAGGIYDQVGGGFARYAVDATWTVPHFEKMLYDNALLARSYLHAWQVSEDQRFADVCTETLEWALREMRGPEGGFYAALDADSEGVEGKFYVWTVDELRSVLGEGELASAAIAHFGATAEGNFDGATNVLEARGPVPEHLPEIRRRLFEARSGRVRPGLDDKRLTGWNALMIAALADAGAALDRPQYVTAAAECAAFLLESLRDEHGRLLRTWKDGEGRLSAYLEDHAYLLEALVTLYEATFEERWYVEAVGIAEAMLKHFRDAELGGFFSTGDDQEHLVTRRKDMQDAPIPSGNSAAAMGLLRLARLTGSVEYERQAIGVMALHAELATRHPSAFGHLLRALDFHLATPREVAIVGENGGGPLTRAVRTGFRPNLVIAGGAGIEPGADAAGDAAQPEGAAGDASQPGGETNAVPLLRGRTLVQGQPAAYVCERFTCQLPVTDVDELIAALEA